jgi:hypothetical protein
VKDHSHLLDRYRGLITSVARRPRLNRSVIPVVVGLLAGMSAGLMTLVIALALFPSVHCPRPCDGLSCSLVGCIVDFRGQAVSAIVVGLVACGITVFAIRRSLRARTQRGVSLDCSSR